MAIFAFETTENDFTLTVNSVEVGTWDKTDKADHAYKVDITGASVILSLNNPYYSADIVSGDTVTIDGEAVSGSMTVKGEAIKDAVFVAGGAVEVTYYSRKTVLTDTQIKALPTTPITLVPAPGAGKMLAFQGAIVRKAFQTAYSMDAIEDYDGIYIKLEGPSTQLDRGFFNEAANSLAELTKLIGPDIGLDLVFQDCPVVNMLGFYSRPELISDGGNGTNQPLVLVASTANGNFTGGHASNTLEVTVFYSIVDL